MLLREVEKYRSLDLMARQVVEGFITGLHRSPFHGFSVEFAEHRLYNTGESTRNIDWKLYGRTDKLFVKRFEEETNLRCHLLIDASSSMFFPDKEKSKIKFATLGAAVLANLLKMQRDAFGLTVFDESIIDQTEVKSSSGHYQNIISKLELLQNSTPVQKKTDVAKALGVLADQIHRRSLVVIFSDMFDAGDNDEKLFAALQHLKFRKHEVVLFHVSDAGKELEFDYQNRPYKFVDVESGEEIKLYPDEVREHYLTKMNEFYANLKAKCNQYKIEFIEADINKDFSQVVLPFLLKRQKMR
ncbi:MAG: DUF58 domain-containing protein [Bacteroidia bacterium]|nr:DUF58 domain-containing protein [Bacteroidia bacterium]